MRIFELNKDFVDFANRAKKQMGGSLRYCENFRTMGYFSHFQNLSFDYYGVGSRKNRTVPKGLFLSNENAILFLVPIYGFLLRYYYDPEDNFGIRLHSVTLPSLSALKKDPSFTVFPDFHADMQNHGFPAYSDRQEQERRGEVYGYSSKTSLNARKTDQKKQYNLLFASAKVRYALFTYDKAHLTKKEFEDMELSLGLGEADLWWEAMLRDNPSYYSILESSEPARFVVVD